MRLTLRTLLAYLDDILEAEDAQQLGQKIQESEVATQLMHRIRHVVGQLRGESVSALAEGLAKDANFVAEYLDNTMPPEKVAEFERLCLESDGLLAEVAACHQIRASVLPNRAMSSRRTVPMLCTRKWSPPASVVRYSTTSGAFGTASVTGLAMETPSGLSATSRSS